MSLRIRRLLLAGTIAILAQSSAGAAPWWWAGFTAGDGSNTSNSQFERWQAFHIAQASDATDTVYVCSFTWGSVNIGTINGINGGNDGGLNSVSAAGGMPSYLIRDDDGSESENAAALSDANVTDVIDAAGSPVMHIKDSFIDRGANSTYFLSSANHTSGGWDSQRNNAIVFYGTGLSSLWGKVRDQMQEMAGGTFHDASEYAGGDIYYSPYGDTIELRYAPEDNDGGTAAGMGSILSRYRQLVASSRESIFFLSDAWSSSVGTDALAADIVAKSGIVWAGLAGDPPSFSDWDATIKSNFEGDANGTLRNEPGAFNRLHSKTFIFDQEVVGTGSANMTASAMYSTGSNDEVNVIVHDFRLGRKYMQHWRRAMQGGVVDPSSDAFDVTAPAGATGLGVTPSTTFFTLTWTPSTSSDVSRYYLFIDTAAMTQNSIGDGLDDDGDTLIDEDPVGDADGFASGTTVGGAVLGDDDADGSVDEDPYRHPEAQSKGGAAASGTISSINVGDSLLVGVNYYFAVVAVDTQGNEGAIATAGPFQLTSGDTKLKVVFNSDIANTTAAKGDTGILAASMWIRGDTGTGGDTLLSFAVANVGTADSSDVTLRLWRDEDADSAVGAADSLVGTLVYSAVTARWETTVAADSRATLPTAGKTFLLVADIAAGATADVTFQARVVFGTIDAAVADSGPSATITNAGAISVASDTGPDTAIVVNEFMANPATSVPPDHDNDLIGNDADEEFVEIYNASDGSVDIGLWDIGDMPSAGDAAFPSGLVMGKRQYVSVFVDGAWFRHDSDGVTILETGVMTGTPGTLTNTGESVVLRDENNVVIDITPTLANNTVNASVQRLIDGWGGAQPVAGVSADWITNVAPSQGTTRDPSTFDSGAANGKIQVSASPTTINEGEPFTLTMTVQDRTGATVTAFAATADATSSTGTISPAASAAFASGVRAESFTVSNMAATDSVTIFVRYGTTTVGTTVITVNNVVLALVTCTVVLEARSDHSGCTGVITKAGYTDTQVSNAAGTITFTNVPAGTYSLATKQDHHLQVTTGGIVVAGDMSVNQGTHRAGDANNDNRINIFDAGITRFLRIFGTGTKADIDGDGDVDNADLQWIRVNFGRTGQ